jgi:hypothetical protein
MSHVATRYLLVPSCMSHTPALLSVVASHHLRMEPGDGCRCSIEQLVFDALNSIWMGGRSACWIHTICTACE